MILPIPKIQYLFGNHSNIATPSLQTTLLLKYRVVKITCLSLNRFVYHLPEDAKQRLVQAIKPSLYNQAPPFSFTTTSSTILQDN